nr:transposon TX1 uncharacterized [Tanacetum cinerariifolium]
MVKQFTSTDYNGLTWVTRNKNSKSIGNPFQKALENVATSFYVTNMPPSLTSKGLWTMCAPHEKLMDAFIANKLSNGGNRFGFIKFLGIKDANEESTALSSGRICISTKSHQLISEIIQVNINNEIFEASVQEIGSWRTKCKDDYTDLSSNHEYKDVDHVSESIDDQQVDDIEIIQSNLNKIDDHDLDVEPDLKGENKDVRNEQERYGSSFNSIEADHFNAFIESTDVTNLLLDIRITALDRLWSDHNPILLQVEKIDFGPPPFKFYNSWLSRDGDENSKFFHGLINQKRRNQMINGLMVDGTWITDPKDRDNLERRVNLDEIKEAIWDCGSSKASGPDGYTFAFVKKLWRTIHKDLHEFVDYFFTFSTMPHGANSSSFTLIPKVNNPTSITDFRPISPVLDLLDSFESG